MRRVSFRLRLLAVLVPVVALACFTAGTAHAVAGAALKVTCTTSSTTTTTTPHGTSTTTKSSSKTLSARISRNGTSRSSATGSTIKVGDDVTCTVVVAQPDQATVTSSVHFTPTLTNAPAPQGSTQVFEATSPGDGEITYALTNGGASIEFKFKYKIVAPPPPV
jgi:hypothetical protein